MFYNEFAEEFETLEQAINAERDFLQHTEWKEEGGILTLADWPDHHPEITHREDGEIIIDWTGEEYLQEYNGNKEAFGEIITLDNDEGLISIVQGVQTESGIMQKRTEFWTDPIMAFRTANEWSKETGAEIIC